MTNLVFEPCARDSKAAALLSSYLCCLSASIAAKLAASASHSYLRAAYSAVTLVSCEEASMPITLALRSDSIINF